MNITIRLTKVEYEMLKELQKTDKRDKRGVEEKIKEGVKKDCQVCVKALEDTRASAGD